MPLEEWLVTILQQEIGKVTLKHLTVPANRKKPRYNSIIRIRQGQFKKNKIKKLPLAKIGAKRLQYKYIQ